jgi:CBS domain containing-hemolysin-like protein
MIGVGLGFVVCVLLSAAFSGMETGLYSLERVRLQVQAASGQPLASRLLRLVKSPTEAVGTILIANNVVNYGVALFSGLLLQGLIAADLSDIELEIRNTLYVVPVLFVLGELLPKRLFLRNPGLLVRLVYPIYSAAALLLKPMVAPLNALARRLTGEGEEAEVLDVRQRRLEVLHMLTRGNEAELLTESQRDLAGRVLRLQALRVAECMVPVESIVSIALSAPREEVVRIGVTEGVGRLPVRDPRGPGFLGYVSVIEAAAGASTEFGMEAALHSMPVVRPRDSMMHALEVIQEARKPMAVVEGPSGPVGLLTTSDVVEALLPKVSDPRAGGGEGGQIAATPSSPGA